MNEKAETVTERERCILFVDHDKAYCDMVAMAFEGTGYNYHLTNSLDAARTVIDEKIIDLIVLDLGTCGQEGLDFCQHLRDPECDEWMPVILTAAMDGAVSLDKRTTEGKQFVSVVSDFLVKPYEIHELFSRIHAQLLSKQTHDRILQQRQQMRASLEAQKTLMNDIQSKNAQLVEINRQKDEILSIASHDLRAPLASVSGYCENLYEGIYGELDNKKARVLGRIQERVDQMLDLLNDLLDISRIESGKLTLKTDLQNVGDLIQEAVNTLSDAVSKKEITLKIEIDESLPRMMLDGQKIRQAFINLISNAVKYSPKNTHVKITATRTEDMTLHFSVQDEGPGIPEAEHSMLFERFSRLSTKPTAGEQQTGLGLSITKSLVELHHGQVGVETEEGKGSTFWILLPLEPVMETPSSPNPAQEEKSIFLGELVVSLGLTTPEAVLAALDIQARERSQSGKARLLGEILVESGFVSKEDLDHALREAKSSS